MLTTTFDIPSPQDVAKEIPLNREHQELIHKWRKTVINILNKKDDRILLIIGPCSIHDSNSALLYGQKIQSLAQKLKDKFFIVMRTYFEKPRTILGWKGFIHDPDLDSSYDFLKGIRNTRSLLVDLTEMHVPCASELLELTIPYFYADFLTWGCIGARTSSSQPHRQLASSMPFPIGFKHSIEGNYDSAIHGIIAASNRQTFIGISRTGMLTRIESEGNAHCNLVLRGTIHKPNYNQKNIKKVSQLCKNAAISSSIIVDCSHDNSQKNPLKQIEIFKEIITQSGDVRALMLESHLLGGSQPITPFLKEGVSITDPCLDWESTEELLLWGYQILS